MKRKEQNKLLHKKKAKNKWKKWKGEINRLDDYLSNNTLIIAFVQSSGSAKPDSINIRSRKSSGATEQTSGSSVWYR